MLNAEIDSLGGLKPRLRPAPALKREGEDRAHVGPAL